VTASGDPVAAGNDRLYRERAKPVHTVLRNCMRDEGGPFEAGRQGQVSNHCKLLSLKAMVVTVAANVGTNPSG
jgi:hypothetical protein